MLESKTYNVGIYIRLSKEDVDKKNESESITNQRRLLLEFVKESGFNLYDEYVDDGVSGTTFERESFNRLIDDIESGKVNTVITKDLSRLGRDYIEAGRYVEKYFPEKRIRYISLLDGYDSEVESYSDDGIPFKLLMNDMYAKDISKKVRASVMSKKKQGLFLGWKACYGYIKAPDNKHKLIIDEEASIVVKRIFNLALRGNSPSQIANTLTLEKIPNPSIYAGLNRGLKSSAYEIWCSRTIDEMLSNPTYAGHLTQGRRKKINYKSKKEVRTNLDKWIINKNTHEPIIDERTFEKVQELRKNKRRQRKNANHLLSGLLYCKECNHAISITKSNDGLRYYCCCSHYRKYSKFNLCTPHTMNYQKLEIAVLEDIREMCNQYVDSSKFENKVEEQAKKKDLKFRLQGELLKAKDTIEKLNDKKDKIYFDKLNEIIDLDMYKRVNNKLNDDIKLENQKIKDIEGQIKDINSNSNKKKKNYLKKIEEYLSFEKPDREVLFGLIDKILLSENKELDIYYKFNI